MNKQSAVIIAIIVFLALFISLASSDPDGLERVVENYGVEEQPAFWHGLMPDYTIPTVENAYISTLLAGIIGVLLVLLVGLAIEKALTQESHASP